jgi:ribosome biogenesis GTPase
MVMSCIGGRYRVFTEGRVVEASLRGRMKQVSHQRVLVGDRVYLAMHDDDSATIEGLEERSSVLRRRSPGKSRGTRVVAANIDQVVVVGAARQPDWDSFLIDRFTAVAEANHLPIVVVINKADLDSDATRHGIAYRQAGYGVLVTSAKTRTGLDQLRLHFGAHVSLLSGPTGVGKSSLLNALVPGLRLRTREVSTRTKTGRHTTVSAEMHALDSEGFVVDTPGLRDIGLWGLEPGEVAAAFPEFATFAGHCRFDNCRHLEEPGCAVSQAIERDELSRSRHESYQRLLEEAARSARPWA